MHRRYEPRHARFAQPDPSGGSYDLTDPQSFNRYAYARNDPVNFADPSGLDPEESPAPIDEHIEVRADLFWEQFRADNSGPLVADLFFPLLPMLPGPANIPLTPQNPATRPLTAEELAAIRSELAKMLDNDNCKAFIDKLVSFNTGQSFDSRSLLTRCASFSSSTARPSATARCPARA